MLKQLLVLCLGLVFMVACGGDDGGGMAPATSGPFRGVLTGSSQTGILEVTISADAARTVPGVVDEVALATYQVSGTLTIGGAPVTLSGTFDDVTNAFSVTGGGYTLTGTWLDGKITGTFTGPSGGGSFGLLSSTAGAVNVYCGTYTGGGGGTWNLVEGADGTLTGSTSSSLVLNGTRSGTSINLTFTGGTATGTASGTTVTGTWTSTDSSGTWQGSTTACSG